jgi:integrase
MVTKFQNHLKRSDLSKNTIASYLWAVNYFFSNYECISKENLTDYKSWLIDRFKPQTVNLRLQAINKYLEFAKKRRLKLKFVRVPQKNFLENVISDADYKFLKTKLKEDGYTEWYFVVWFLTATGARINELLQIKVEHIEIGYMDMYTKGRKVRRLHIPKTLRKEAAKWLKDCCFFSGYIFRNRYDGRITARGISQKLKRFAKRYGLNSKVIYPHSFRHRFAKNFLDKCNDIALLADLMGHESIETTRIYLRRTASEQQRIVDKVITW